jgi:4F5 protein related disordered region
MTRGNQREKAREKNIKDQAGKGKKNNQSGTEFKRTQEAQATIMREKQAKAAEKKATEGESAGGKKK